MNLIKREIIPDDFKSNIDEILEEQLLNANRNYAEDNKEIYDMIDQFIKIRPENYLRELIDRWNWHNNFYEDMLEPAYKELMRYNLNELTPKQVDEFIKIYKTCLNVDKATMITSCGIKKHLDYWVNKISVQNEDLNQSDSLFMLLTPMREPFYVQYQIDHLKYIILKKINSSDIDEWKNYLLDMYHANDVKIFNSRYLRDFKKQETLDVQDLRNLIKSYEFDDSYKARHYYFMAEHPDRKAFNAILSYDNFDEKLLAFKLIGISGFLYRKAILDFLNESEILKNKGYIYEFSDKTVLDSLYLLKEQSERTMIKNVPTYKQTFDSCAIVCMLSVLEYYNKIDLIDFKKEKFYFNKYKSKYLIGTPFSALAYELCLNDLDVDIYHSSNDLFDNNDCLPKSVFDNGMKEYKSYLNGATINGARIFKGIDINSDFLLKQLKSDQLIILAGNHGEYLHSILLCGYSNNNFIVFDPLIGKNKILSHESLNEFMDTSLGTWCISVKSKTPNKDMLINRLDYFDNSSYEKINYKENFQSNNVCYSKKYVKRF